MQGSAFCLGLAPIIARWLQRAACLGVIAITIRGIASDISPATSAVTFAPPRAWVKPQFFNRQASLDFLESSADEYLLLQERQINVPAGEIFHHSVRQILTTAGVQNGATITIDFNPAYQSLTWHWARIWRGAEHLERLDTNEVKIVQPERDIDQYILDGRKSAILVLNDVRIGDIIDYSYSLTGTNPVFGAHFSTDVPVQEEQPADRLVTRVLWPTQRHLYAKPQACSVQPTVAGGKEVIEYVWDLRQMPAATIEDSLPAWYDPEPYVQLSEFQTWAEVNQWALALFKVTSPCSPELARKIAEWKQIASQEDQVLAVLRFVQDNVRYFGIEIGESGEKPADPSTVFARRFGDCKDKSLLFVTVLRALGIEAYPVLVNATMGRAVEEWQPSAESFDHCIALVQFNNQQYWVDPTMNYQRGPLAAHYLPGYGCGLVVAPGSTSLTLIPHLSGLPQTTITEYFQLGRRAEPAQLRVVTIAEGGDAESLRGFFAETKRNEIEKHYTHFYSTLYPGIKMSSSIAIEDDEQQNRIQTTEFYTIDNAWTESDKTRSVHCDFYPSTVGAFLKRPVDVNRNSPLGISFPQHHILRTEVTLPSAWPFESDDKSIQDPVFTFRKTLQRTGRKLVMEYEYRSLDDSVAPERVGEYLQQINRASQLLGYTLIAP
jgi:transglutaminase-like putative cysteine protease